jgi:hypothetical protein
MKDVIKLLLKWGPQSREMTIILNACTIIHVF